MNPNIPNFGSFYDSSSVGTTSGFTAIPLRALMAPPGCMPHYLYQLRVAPEAVNSIHGPAQSGGRIHRRPQGSSCLNTCADCKYPTALSTIFPRREAGVGDWELTAGKDEGVPMAETDSRGPIRVRRVDQRSTSGIHDLCDLREDKKSKELGRETAK